MEFADNSTVEVTFEDLHVVRDSQVVELPEIGAVAEIEAGQTQVYSVPKALKNSFLSLSTCSQPGNPSTGLKLVVDGTDFESQNGLAVYASGNMTTVKVTAPKGSGSWTYELGIGQSGSSAVEGTDLYYVDSDFANSLLVTSPLKNITDDILQIQSLKGWEGATVNASLDTLELSLYSFENSTINTALSRSYCGVNRAPLMNQNNADLSYTTRGSKHQQRAQYLLPGLNQSSMYVAYLSYSNAQLNKSATVPPLGGVVLGPVLFSTKQTTSCQLVYNMTFCSEMAFAVPGNASAFTVNQLTEFYDEMALSRYKNFTKSLQQESCQGPLEDRYSVLRTCEDCDVSYRNWLCAITIPRCADWNLNASYLMPRPQGASRNPDINRYIDPGKYKEVLPCKELCFDLVRDCPASLGFSCPNKHMLNLSYGSMSEDGFVTCSYPGAVYFEDGAFRASPPWLLAILMLLLVAL